MRRQGADHRYIPLLVTAPGFGWITAFTVASEIGDIKRFASPTKLCGYTGLCPRVYQSGNSDRRGPISKQGSRYLRWALFEAALHACKQTSGVSLRLLADEDHGPSIRLREVGAATPLRATEDRGGQQTVAGQRREGPQSRALSQTTNGWTLLGLD